MLSSRQPTASQSAMSEGRIERYKSDELVSQIASSASLICNIQVLGKNLRSLRCEISARKQKRRSKREPLPAAGIGIGSLRRSPCG